MCVCVREISSERVCTYMRERKRESRLGASRSIIGRKRVLHKQTNKQTKDVIDKTDGCDHIFTSV